MKVLFVLGGKVSPLHKKDDKEGISFYIKEQADGLENLGVSIDYFRFKLTKFNALSRIIALRRTLKKQEYDLIHAHYGLFGFLTLFTFSGKPLVTTFHGSDINIKKNRYFSSLAIKLSSYSIFVSNALYQSSWIQPKTKFEIIPCGVDMNIFYPIDKSRARKALGYDDDCNYILFSSRFSNPIKNYALAKKSLDLLDVNFKVIELAEKSREEVNLIMNACDLLLMTSKSEGSPQVVKEALSTNLPIVSVNVGDVHENIYDIENCYVVEGKPDAIADKVSLILKNPKRPDASSFVKKFDTKEISNRILRIYKKALV